MLRIKPPVSKNVIFGGGGGERENSVFTEAIKLNEVIKEGPNPI